MASYVHKKDRAFRDANTPDLVPRRSEGRMKTYPSTTDARAWCDEIEERRQHIIELIRKDISKGVSIGKFVPIDVIIDTLLANKNADIEKLKQQLEELRQLLDMYEKLDLTEDQKRQLGQQKQQLHQMEQNMGRARTIPEGDGGQLRPVEETVTRASSSALGAGSGGIRPSTYSTKDDEIVALRLALAEKEAEAKKHKNIAKQAIEQLEEIQDIVEERDHLRKQLEASKFEIETLRRPPGADRSEPGGSGAGGGQAQALEAQMAALRETGQLTPEQEVELMKQQLEAVKKDCEKLGALQAENSRLKKELEGAKAAQTSRGTTADPDIDADNNVDSLKQKLHECKEDRDKLRARCQQLESELLKFGDLPEEVEVLQQKSKMLDSVTSERDSLYARLKELEGIEDEIKDLKAKADRADALERQLSQLQQDMQREAAARRNSSDALARDAADLRNKAKEADLLKVERDQLRMRLNQLADIEAQYMDLLDRTRGFDALRNERDMYKQKYEELLGLECECDILRAQLDNAREIDQERNALQRQVRECECCIADQEDEIKRLVTHVDRLTNGKDDQQERAKEVIANMRKEIDDKDQLLTTSAEQLAQVQDQLKSTIQNVSSETAQLKARIEELEKLLKEKDDLIKELVGKERESEGKDDVIDKMRAELEAARAENEKLQHIAEEMAVFTGDEHFQDMLHESKTAVEKVKEHLEAQYDEWDCVKKKRDSASSAPDLFGKYSEERQKADALTADLEKCQQRVKELEAQLKNAQNLVARLQEKTGDFEQTSAENLALRRHSAEVQDVAKEQIEELVEHLRKAREKIAELEAENDRLQRRLQDTSRELQTVDESEDSDSLQKLRKELEDVQQEKAKLEALIKSLQESPTGDDAQQELMRLKTEYAALEDELQKEIQRRQAAENRVRQLEEELASKTAGGDTEELDRLKKQLKEANAEIERLEEALLKHMTQSEQKIARLNKDVDDLTDTVIEKTRRSSVQASELEEELQRLKAENQKLQAQLEEARKALSTAAQTEFKETRRRSSQIKELDEELERLKAENQKLQAQLEEALSTAAKTEFKETRSRSSQIKDLDEELERLKAENQKLQAQLKETREALSTAAQTESKVVDTTAKAVDTSELNALREERDKLLKQIEEQNKEIATLLEQMVAGADEAAAAELEKQRKEKKELQDLINKLEKQVKDLSSSQQVTDTSDLTTAETVKIMTEQLEEEERNTKEWKEKHAKCQEELEKLRQLFKEKTGDTAPATIQVDTTETNELKEKYEKCQQELEQLRAQSKNQTPATTQADNTELNELKAKYEKCQQELDKLRKSEEIASVTTQADNTDEDILRQQLKNCQAELKKLKEFESISGKCQEEIEKLKQQLSETDDLLQIERKKSADAAQELQQLQEATAGGDPEGASKAMQNTIKDLKSENEALQKEIASLKQKINKLEDENRKLKDQLGGAVTEVERTRRTSKEWEKKYSQSESASGDELQKLRDTIASLQEQYDRDIKNLHNKHDEAVAKLQEQHDQAMKDLREEYEKEINSLRDQLKGQQRRTSSVDKTDKESLTSKTMEVVDIKPKKCTCGSKMDRILEKALKNGMEALDFDELKYVHSKVCDATTNLLNKGATRDAPLARQLPTMESEKLLLLQKINSLEKDLLRKQKQTQLKVAQLQIAVRIERERLEELRNSLDEERSRNGELVNKIGAQNKTVANMQMERELLRKQTTYHEEKLENLIMAIEEERGMMQSLQQDLKKEKGHVKKLKTALDQERAKAKTKERELESIRIKYEKAANNEMMLQMELEQKPQDTDDIECSAPCSYSTLQPRQDGTAVVPVPDPDEDVETTTFYTELTIRDAQNRQNFVHNTIMRRADRGAGTPTGRRSSGRSPKRPH